MLQVGGHPGTVHAHGAWVVKECLATEAHFYQDACAVQPSAAAAALQAWMPACWGIADVHGCWLPGWPQRALPAPLPCGAYTLYLENLTAPFVRANVCDIKLGTVLYDETDPHVLPDKRAKMERKARETTSAEHGVRVTGWCVWDERAQSFALIGKEPGRAARTRDDVADLLRRALGTDDAQRAQLVRTHLLPRLGALRADLATIPLRVRSASVLVVTEGDAATLDARLASGGPVLDVRLIDFAHTRWADACDEGALLGLQVLYELCGRLAT